MLFKLIFNHEHGMPTSDAVVPEFPSCYLLNIDNRMSVFVV